MFGASPATKGFGFGKYSSNTSGLGFGSVPSYGEGEQRTGFLFGGSGGAGPAGGDMSMTGDAKNCDSSAVTNVFGKLPISVIGTGGSSAFLAGGNQPASSTSGQCASALSFGRVDLNVDAPAHQALKNSPWPLFGAAATGLTGSAFTFGSKLTPPGSTNAINVPDFGNASNTGAPTAASAFPGGAFTFGSQLTPPGSTNAINVPAFGNAPNTGAPAAASAFPGGVFTFGSQLTTPGITNTSNVPAFGNTSNTGAPTAASAFPGGAFTFGSQLTTAGITNTSNVPAFGNTSNTGAPTAASAFPGGAFTFRSQLTKPGITNTSNVPAFGNTSNTGAPTAASAFPGGAFTFRSQLTTPGITNTSNVPAFGNTSNTGAPTAASAFPGGAFTFGSQLTTPGITNTSNVPAFGNTSNTGAPTAASAFPGGAFTFRSQLTTPGITNTSNVPAFGNTSNTGAPTAASALPGGDFTFGSKLTLPGSTNTSNVPAFGNRVNTVASTAASGFIGEAFTFGSKLTPLGNTSTLKNHAFRHTANTGAPTAASGFTRGAFTFDSRLTPLGGGSNTKPYQPTPMVDNTGKKTAENLQSKSAMQNYQGKSHEELRWEDYQYSRGYSWADSAVQPSEKIGSNISRTMQNLSPVSVGEPTFATPNVHYETLSGTFTAPGPVVTQLSSAWPEVTLKPAWWAVAQPGIASIPTTPVPATLSTNGQSLPSSSWFLGLYKPAPEPKVSLGKDPLQTSQGITFPTTPQDPASTPSIPLSNKISPIYSIGDAQPAVKANPFDGETRSFLHLKSSTLVQQGISGIPMVSKPTPVKTSSLLRCRHLSSNRVKLPARKPTRIDDDPKVPFFHDEFSRTTKGHSWIIARESPKVWISNPTLVPSPTYNLDTTSPVNSDGASGISPGNLNDDKTFIASLSMLKIANGEENVQNYSNNSIISLISEEPDPETLQQLPKLQLPDYYTEPSMEELAAKEKEDPGFLSRVKNFVVGRHGYGYIKFKGETDVRQLDITSILQFNHREVLVYPDGTTKPPIGEGLNKPAEISLLNIKPINKNWGLHYTHREKADKYKMMLIHKSNDNGAEFISYDPVAGEWKFRVPHFSCN